MNIHKQQLEDLNKHKLQDHKSHFDFLAQSLSKSGAAVDKLITKLADFQVAIPSWALGAGGTRFGRFSYGGEPASLEQKIEDIGLIHRLTQTAGAVSLHIPWDVPNDYNAIKELAAKHQIKFDAVNSNTFQDQKNQKETYKYGSLSNTSSAVREQAIAHNKEVVEIGNKLGSKALTVWLADGSSFPGQNNFQTALTHTQNSLISIYEDMPTDWKLYIEYKPYEPNFYSTVIQDWGTSLMLANGCGERAYTLVDLGHHLPNTNIEQIVSVLMLKGKLGGFHFNDSKYGDDDLTVGSIKPYALFLIFNELVYGIQNNPQNPELGWMIDASHNVKDPLEDLIQSLEAIQEAYAKALLIDQDALRAAQEANDVTLCQELLQNAYRTDVRPLVREARLRSGGALNPIEAYRKLEVRKNLIAERGSKTVATGL
ncbi:MULTISPECIES: sugar isomerase [unclassified Leeuwenhoekiella]|uniref:sugar isomerase n=1 Tax=unclassified Leeuwenhoekiella TaxID=2615029 RepID=UPI000C37BA35|nr:MULTISPECIES: sugar isomerase [unclassified Leeuwenhoekiella]MAW97049.1 sugar isomerase [Leeuwenhoekiella sp.]MBA80670.1 sugar isomerase [Leeuwenhoekiella sp.]|tara:strand:- start:14715 stop:15995 length:1281 start_codon:yes stop_codon:yes gene_type:complete